MTKAEKNNKDIEMIKNFAKICWIVDEEGNIDETYANINGTNVFAIIDRQRNKIVLEIGLSGSKPYNRHYNKSVGVEIQKRKKEYSLTERQYKKLGFKIWEQLQEVAVNILSGRKSGEVFYRKVSAAKSFKCVPRIKFIFDKRDNLLVEDIYFSEMFLNKAFQSRMEKIKCTIKRKASKNKKNFLEIASQIFFPDYIEKHGYKPMPYYIIKYFMEREPDLTNFFQYFLILLQDREIPLDQLDQKIKMAEIASKQIDEMTQLRIYKEDDKNILVEIFISPP